MTRKAEKVQEPMVQGTPGTKQKDLSKKSGKTNSPFLTNENVQATFNPIDQFVNVVKLEGKNATRYSIALRNFGLLKEDELCETEAEAKKLAQTAIIAYRTINAIQIMNEQQKEARKRK